MLPVNKESLRESDYWIHHVRHKSFHEGLKVKRDDSHRVAKSREEEQESRRSCSQLHAWRK